MKITVFWDVMQPGRNLQVFCRNLLPPSSRQSDIQSTLNKKAVRSIAMFINFYQINHSCIPEEGNHQYFKPIMAITNLNAGRSQASFNNNIHATHYFDLLYILKKK
jgi:hypothetical protein